MGGGLLQLVAYGSQDAYLTADPQITFFKTVYRRHTHFGQEPVEMSTLDNIVYGMLELGKECCIKLDTSIGADLINDMWLEITLSNPETNIYGIGNAIIKSVALEFDNQLIEEHTAGWMNIYGEMFNDDNKRNTWDKLVGNCIASETRKKLFVPLRFFFCTNHGNALPISAMKNTQKRLIFHFAQREDLNLQVDCNVSIKVMANCIFLDTEERKRFLTTDMTYLIEQVQIQEFNIDNGDNRHVLEFKNTVKALYWTLNKNNESPCKSLPLHTNKHVALGQYPAMRLLMNGMDRFELRPLDYFLRWQPYRYHVNNPRENLIMPGQENLLAQNPPKPCQGYDQNIYMYSFALSPAEHQPSGTCNMSRIENCSLSFFNLNGIETADNILTVYAHSYNTFYVKAGIGKMEYPINIVSPRQRKLYKR